MARERSEHQFETPLCDRLESIEFLKNLDGEAADGSEEIEARGIIADRLKGLPLALSLVTAYIQRSSMSYTIFLKHYQSFEKNLILNEVLLPHYDKSVSTALTMWLCGMSKGAKEIIEMLVLLDHDSVPVEFFDPVDLEAKYVSSKLL